jgi:hypothetical protein
MVRPSSFLLEWETPRTVITTPEIEAITREPFADTDEGERLAEFGAWLNAFSEHGEVSVSNVARPKPWDTMLARVDPPEAGFWSIRVTDPPGTQGMRGLGGFVGLDELVVLTWDFREKMPLNFDDAVEEVIEVWRDYFGDIPPLQSEYLDDHLTNYYRVA